VNDVDKVYSCRKFTALKHPRQYPLVLLVKVGRRQGRPFGSEEGRIMGIEV
jgi:hypothetical protein